MGDRVLVGGLKAGDTPDTPSPTMLTIDAAGSQTPVPLNPQSPYAPLARWYSVATDGTRIVAIGGANGGAHANVRWTTWAGTAAGVDELPQSFYAFGGWGAGDLVDAVITPGGDALVGSWGGAKAGLDAAVWTFADRVWTRQESAGTALESTATLLVGPRGATGDGDGVLVTGSALHLDQGVDQTAAVWRSSGVNTGWHRIDLPGAGTHSEAVSAQCSPADGSCLVTGQVISYVKARADSVQLIIGGALAERAERNVLGLVGAGLSGLGVPHAVDVGLWLLAAAGLITVVQRLVQVRRAAVKAATEPGPRGTGRPAL